MKFLFAFFTAVMSLPVFADTLPFVPTPDAPEVGNCPAGYVSGASLYCNASGRKTEADGGCSAAAAEASNDLNTCVSRHNGACTNAGGQPSWGGSARNPQSGCIQVPGSTEFHVTMAQNGICCNGNTGVPTEGAGHDATCPKGMTEVWSASIQGSGSDSSCSRAEQRALSDAVAQISAAERNCRNGGYTFVQNLSAPKNGTSCSTINFRQFAVRSAHVICCQTPANTTPEQPGSGILAP